MHSANFRRNAYIKSKLLISYVAQSINMLCVVIGLCLFLFFYMYWKSLVPSCLPPGPKGWPFIGHLDLIYHGQTKNFHVITDKWGKQYGGLYSLQIMHMPGVMLTDLAVIKEALLDNADVWSDRPLNNPFLRLTTKDIGGVIFQNGRTWRKLRKLAVQSMKEFGGDNKSMEKKILDEVNEVIKEIGSTEGKPFQFDLLFNRAVLNVICNILFGNRYSYNEPAYQKLTTGLNELFKGNGFQNIFLFLPWYMLWLMPLLQPNIRKLLEISKYMESFIKQVIREHRETFDSDNLRDFVDMYIAKEQSGDYDTYSEQRIFQTIVDLIWAGGETTSSALLWTFIFLTKHLEIQDKCRQQIKEQIGLNRPPSLEDKVKLPYVEATIFESLRRGNIAPVLLFHNTARTAQLRGFTIPKDTTLMINIYAVHMSSEQWDDPESFRPERFLDQHGAFKRPEGFIAFGLGQRACFGENLARMDLFLFITSLLQKFEFQADDVSTLPSVEKTSLGMTLIPDKYFVQATRII